MKIAFNPSTVAALTSPPDNKDITFDLRGHNIFARGVKFQGTDTNTWRDIKINNVSIGSHTLDLRNGSNTTLTNTNGVVIINSTWRPVVDNLTSDSTTSSLSANQGRVLAGLINGKSDSDHNHDGRYLKLTGGTLTGNLIGTSAMFSGRFYGNGDDEGIIIKPSSNGYAGLILGTHDGERSIFYFVKNKPFWRYSHGSDNLDIIHPKKSGTIALTSDIPLSLKNPHALTISLNGTSQGPYDGSAAKNINITPGSIGAATSDHNHDGRYVYNYGGIQMDGASVNKNALGMTTNSGITGDQWHILQAAWNDEYRWNSQIAFPTQNRNGMYYRSGLDDNTKWGSWVKLLDTNNYSSTLDSRYYTESEVNSLLSKKLDRVNLTTGSWNPRGYHLAADYHYNGGDLSISENSGQIHVSIDGYFWQNEGKYRVLDTSDVAGLKGDLTVHQYLSATDATWCPLIWGGSSHANTGNSTGAVYKSHDKLSWQTSTQTLYATNIQTENIRHLSIGGGIYWNPYVKSATDGSDAASITLVKSGVAGGTTLVLSQMNDTNDTIQFKTNAAARLYHNSYPILTIQNTYVSNGKGYINGTEITQVNNSDTIDGWHKNNIQWTGYITSGDTLASYWFKMYDITVTGYKYNDITITFLVSEGFSSHFSIFYLRIRQNGTNNSGNYNLGISLYELVGNLRDKVVAYYNNSTGNVQLWGNTGGQWGTMNYTVLKKTTRTATDSYSLGTLTAQSFSSVQTPPSTGYSKVTMSRVGSVSYSDSTGSVHWNNVTNKPSSFTPSSHTHTWTSITDKIVASNEFNIVNAGFKENLWFNYLPINDRSKSATISAYCFGNGNKGYTAVRASGFIKNGGNSEQLLRADGGIATFNWSGQAGQPTWLWGGNDFNSYYVYNPSNFRVAYANSAGNAETLGGMPKNYGQAPFGTIPCIGNNGVMEIGRYIDYHYDNSGKYDFSTRLQTTGNYKNVVSLPSASGTLALVSQVLTWKSQIIDMRSYSESYWHPVTVSLPNFGYNKIKVSVQLNSGDKPSWATHNSGFTCNMEIWATASGWGTTDSDTICLNYTYKFCSQNPCGWMQLGNPSLGVVFLRGGSRYTVYTDFDATFTPHNQKYTWSNGSSSQDTGGPYTSCPGLNFNMGAIRADLIATLVQARRVCAGHDPGIDNSISCSNWFRSSGNTGWYNTTYKGGWYMSDTSWIRAHNGVGIYTGGQIYAGSSIRMGSIRLERTNEINSSDKLFINYGSSTNVSLCYGGGNVGIGTISPTQKLDVNGNITTKGFGIQPCYLSELNLLPTISPGDGYEYKCLEIGRTTYISCIIADKAGLMSERGILIKFNKGYDGQIILLKDLQSYGIGNGNFWVMPSGCNIIKADGSSILVGQNQISNIYDDGHSRFLVYSSLHNVWIEFLCS